MKIFVFILLMLCAFADKKATIENHDNIITIKLDGKLFAKYNYGKHKPYLYPVIGPTSINMTRNYPMKDVTGELKDHPWQSSIYYTHGRVNGIDFWNEKSNKHKHSKIILDKIEQINNISPTSVQLVATHKWLYKNKVEMTDRTTIVFSGSIDKHIIDFTITLMAKDKKVVLGDSKEGCFAIRMHQKLRADMKAKVLNSSGIEDIKEIWGKKAKWICYYNTFGKDILGISIFDHPTNLRHPTTWHARHYGLCAANPFGLKHFTKDKTKDGSYTINKGDSLTFKYRIIMHKNSPKKFNIKQKYENWIKQ